MKKGKRVIQIKINFTNRWLYTFIAIGIIAAIGVGVYALTPGVAPNPGHLISEMAPPSPCLVNQSLQFNGTDWKCGTVAETDPNVASWAKPDDGRRSPVTMGVLRGSCVTSVPVGYSDSNCHSYPGACSCSADGLGFICESYYHHCALVESPDDYVVVVTGKDTTPTTITTYYSTEKMTDAPEPAPHYP